jgi:hypothetical protein
MSEWPTTQESRVGCPHANVRSRFIVRWTGFVNTGRHIGTNPVSLSALAICHSSLRSWQAEYHQYRFQG